MQKNIPLWKFWLLKKRNLQKLNTSRSVYFVFFLGVFLTCFLCFLNYSQQQKYQNALFQKELTKITGDIQKHFHNFELLVESTSIFFTSQDSVKHSEWQAYAEQIMKNPEYSGLYDLLYIKYIPQIDPSLLTKKQNYFSHPHLSAQKNSTPEEKCLIAYSFVPSSIGINICNKPSDIKTLNQIREHNKNYELGTIEFPNEDESRPHFHLIAPTFSSRLKKDDSFQGWIVLSIDLKKFFQPILSNEFIIHVYKNDENSTLVYTNDKLHSDIKRDIKMEEAVHTSPLLEVNVRVSATSSSPFFQTPLIMYLAFGLGVFLSFLLAWLVKSLNDAREKTENLNLKIKEDLHLTNLKNKNIVDNIPGGVYHAVYEDEAWKIKFVSDAIYEITGYPALKFINQDRLSIFHSSKQDQLQFTQLLKEGYGKDHSFTTEYKINHADGTEIWVSENARIISHSTMGTHLIGILFDITQSHQQIERMRNLRLALENAVEGIAILDPHLYYKKINKAYAEMYQFEEKSMITLSWLDMIFIEDRKKVTEEIRHINARYTTTVRSLKKDGTIFYKYFVLLPMVSEEGINKGYYCFSRDVTESVKKERTLAKALAAAEKANQTKSEFLATMSHELRTPLNAIIGYSEMMIEEAENPADREDLKKINSAGHHLLELINDILDVSKLEAGKIEFYYESFEIQQMAQYLVDMLQASAAKKKNTLTLNCPEDMGSMLSDLTRVRQCLLNLLGNACKFTENGHVQLTISTELVYDEEHIRFAVSDTGCGITKQQLKKLFKPFSQADSSTTRKYGGTGLGLAITKKFTELLHGNIIVETQPGVGSTFIISLPRTQTNGQKSSKSDPISNPKQIKLG